MTPATDARINTSLPSHHKTKKLIRLLGKEGGWFLICLFLWATVHRSDGDLEGLTDDDIELAIDWSGASGSFVQALAAVGFLDGAEGSRQIHDWAEHNPWAAGAEDRSAASRFAALCKRYGRDGAAERMPEYASRMRTACDPDAPLPLPLPLPIPTAISQSAAAPADLLGEAQQPIDLQARKAERLASVTDEAIEAFNRILAQPNGLLPSVRRKVGAKTRQAQVRRSLPVIAEICEALYHDKRITPQFWDDYFTTCSNDPWLRGEGPYTGTHANWKPDFEFLTKPETVLKVFDRTASAVA